MSIISSDKVVDIAEGILVNCYQSGVSLRYSIFQSKNTLTFLTIQQNYLKLLRQLIRRHCYMLPNTYSILQTVLGNCIINVMLNIYVWVYMRKLLNIARN